MLGVATMPDVPPPTDALAELAQVLGDDNVRTLVRTFLRDFPASLQELQGGDRKNRHRVAHSMKSNSRLMGALELSQRMAGLEARLEGADGADVTPADIAAITKEYETIARALRAFVGE
jgi:HPt (histidine-containing phosphotransfer) domain-containing protein